MSSLKQLVYVLFKNHFDISFLTFWVHVYVNLIIENDIGPLVPGNIILLPLASTEVANKPQFR